MAAQAPIISPYVNQTSQGSYDYTYASLHELAWQPGSSVDVPEFRTDIYPAYYRLYGDGFRLSTFLYAAGLIMPGWTSSRMTVFEEPELEKTVELDGDVVDGSAAGASLDLVIAIPDATYPLLGRSVFLPGQYFNGGVSTTPKEFQVTDWDPNTRTAEVTPLSADTEHDNGDLPDGLVITVGAAKFGRGGGQPQSFRRRNLQRDFYVTILGETKEWEGGVNTYRPELGVIDSQGNKTLFDKGMWELEFLLERSKDKTIWLSEYNTNSVTKTKRDGVTTANVESFVGLRNHLDDRAQQLPYQDTIEPQDLKKIREIYESQGVMADMSWGGFGPRLFENMQDSGLEFVKEYSQGSDLFKNLNNLGANVGVIDLYKHKLVITELKTLADLTSFGNKSYNFQNEGFIIPMAKFAVKGNDGVKVSMNNIGIGYRKGNNENRTLMSGVVAGVNGMGFPFVDQFDSTAMHMKCEFGLVALGVNQWINVVEV
jgi:hypothetical protein